MREYIVRRLLYGLATLWGVSIIVFFLVRLIPGDAVYLLLGEEVRSKEQADALRHELGIDKPILNQYVDWTLGILRGNFGNSLYDGNPVFGRIMKRIPISLEIAILALMLGILLAIPIGVISAIRQDTGLDYVLRVLAILGLSLPSFWLGTALLVMPSIWWHWVPPLGFAQFTDDPVKNLQQIAFPVAVLAIIQSAAVMRLARSSLLEVMRQDYIRTAWAKGLRERVVIARHGLKNAMIPVVTLWGVQMGNLLGGSVILESIFSIPGLGRLTLEAITIRDYTQVQGNILFFALIFFTMNLLVDILYAWIDPRIKYT